ncbi:hypothetical protein GCM10010124_02330 [Pilimelia terevasa]|uniref:Holin n=1 Tax=Pilimelia terevasa TaxID=53372 RepID=A0A8J3FH89_9ACTN|nr:hypothetical protein [Pilimelia terevasa]GGK13275.1 hypothetical protein GCM10010124_02330 [Pilimelia terevasa]
MSSTPPSRDARRRRIRTRFQTFLAGCAVLLVALPVLAQTFEQVLPAKAYAILSGCVLAITAVASAITRVMALPAVTNFIDRFLPWLSQEHGPDREPTDLHR